MGREIKFRVWDKDVCAYIDRKHTFDFTNYLRLNFDEGNGIVIGSLCPGRYTYEQYTGLKDKNGKEIYEGDIVKVNGEVALNNDICVDPIAKIVWVDSAAGFGEKFTVKKAPMMPIGLYKYEIIGDIHENPELLGGQNETNN